MATFQAKRVAPKPVSPLVYQGVRYETPMNGNDFGFAQKAGVLIAYDDVSGEKLWAQLVYQIEINEKFERDVQDCHITNIELDATAQSLIISNERRQRFAIKLVDRSVMRLN